MADKDLYFHCHSRPPHLPPKKIYKVIIIILTWTDTETSLRAILNSRILYSNDGSKAISDSALFLFLGSSSEAITRIGFKILLEDNLEPRQDKNASFVLRINEGKIVFMLFFYLYYLALISLDIWKDLIMLITVIENITCKTKWKGQKGRKYKWINGTSSNNFLITCR